MMALACGRGGSHTCGHTHVETIFLDLPKQGFETGAYSLAD